MKIELRLYIKATFQLGNEKNGTQTNDIQLLMLERKRKKRRGVKGRKNLFDVALREVEDALVFARDRNERTSTSIPELGVESDISVCDEKIERKKRVSKRERRRWKEGNRSEYP